MIGCLENMIHSHGRVSNQPDCQQRNSGKVNRNEHLSMVGMSLFLRNDKELLISVIGFRCL